MRFLLLGAGGQLGRELRRRLPGEVVIPDRAAADLSRPEQLRRTVDELSPDIVVNCAAYNFVDRGETEPDLAFTVNAWAPRELARWCARHDRLLVHFSTDHVFGMDARRDRPYTEMDGTGPVSVYGASKLTGENLVRSLCPRHLVIRTCGLYGLSDPCQNSPRGKGNNFVEVMLRLAREKRTVRVVDDQVCTPTPAADLAEATVELLERKHVGLVHRTCAGDCTWFRFARAIFEIAGMDVDLVPISTREYGAPGRRPAYSVLGSRWPRLRHWTEGLAAYLTQRRQAIQPMKAA
jgi:dTDP-4-dehydrorhamnose reductase